MLVGVFNVGIITWLYVFDVGDSPKDHAGL